MKVCKSCYISRNVSEYGLKGKYLSSICKQCCAKLQKKFRKDRTEGYLLTIKRKNLKRRYGISVEQYNILFKLQNGRCKICEDHQDTIHKALYVDHCHNSNKIRGLLCHRCNTLLGHARDSKDILLKAIDYLD